jgi:hypothetical protein
VLGRWSYAEGEILGTRVDLACGGGKNSLLGEGDGLGEAIPGSAGYDANGQPLAAALPVGPLEQAVDHLEDDAVAADEDESGPLAEVAVAHKVPRVVRVPGYEDVVGQFGLGQDRVHPPLEALPTSAWA